MIYRREQRGKIILLLLVVLVLVALGAGGFFVAKPFFLMGKTIHQLMLENKQLKGAIANLTYETQIGYAKVISQEKKDGKFFTHLRFRETDRTDQLKIIGSPALTLRKFTVAYYTQYRPPCCCV